MTLLNEVKARAAEGTCPPCLGSQALDNKEKIGLHDVDVAYILSSPFLGGIETVSVLFL